LKNRVLALLSGEGTTLSEGEAKSIFFAYDQDSKFETPMPRVLLARTEADPFVVGSRIAFARRVGYLIDDPKDAAPILTGHSFRFRCYDLASNRSPPDPGKYLDGIDGTVNLTDPEFELTLVRGSDEYLAVTAPSRMRQGWARRRPRTRPFFHPSAIFPKLARALFNLSQCKEGGRFLDPFAGTGSILIEASLAGAQVVALDQSEKMVRGALANMKGFGQEWLGLVRADSSHLPISEIDAVATDVPYGRAASPHGRKTAEILELILPVLARTIVRGGFVTIMHPQDIPIEGNGGLAIVQEHHLHVHKLLTRTITVLRRR
jgi:putative methyltransferase (TIGR01177 family)